MQKIVSQTWVRIALSLTLLLVLAGGVLAFITAGQVGAKEQESTEARLESIARDVAQRSAGYLSGGAPFEAFGSVAKDVSNIYDVRVTIDWPDGKVVADSTQDYTKMPNEAGQPEIAAVLKNHAEMGTTTRINPATNTSEFYISVPIAEASDPSTILGVARVAVPSSQIEAQRSQVVKSVATAAVLVLIPAIAVVLLLARSIVGPLATLRKTAQRFGRGDYAARAEAKGQSDIDDLAREFNSMADQVAGTMSERTAERNLMVAMLAYMHDGIVITDSEGHVEAMNLPASTLFATPADQAEGRTLTELSGDQRLGQVLSAALARPGQRQNLDIELQGRQLSAAVTGVPSATGDKPTGLVVLQDVTDLRRLQRNGQGSFAGRA